MSATATARASRPAGAGRRAPSWEGAASAGTSAGGAGGSARASGSAGTAAGRAARPARAGRPAQASQSDEGALPRPRLRVVRGSAPARATLPFLALIILVLAGALVASMLLNARMADTAYRMKEAQVELNVLNDHVETLRTDVQEASAPDALATRAAEQGMVPSGVPGAVDLERSTLSEGTPAESE